MPGETPAFFVYLLVMVVLEYIGQCRYNKGGAKRIAPFLENPAYLKELVNISCSDLPHPYPEYASWLLLNVCKKRHALIEPYIHQIIDRVLLSPNQSVLRNLTSLLNYFPVGSYREGELLDKLLEFIRNDSNKVALFVYAIYLLAKFTIKYPEIKPEILGVIENKQHTLTPAVRVGIRNYLTLTKEV